MKPNVVVVGSWRSCTPSGSATARRRPSRPRCWTRALSVLHPHDVPGARAEPGNRASGAISCVHPAYQKPELLATAPNQLWSWDITKLLGPAKWTYFYLYVILDVFSRYVVGWMVAHARGAALAEAHRRDDAETRASPRPAHAPRRPRRVDDVQAGGVLAGRPGRHQDPLAPARVQRQPVLGGQFQTLKYRPDFPERFGSIEDARAFGESFFPWYNNEHRHSRARAADAGDGPLRRRAESCWPGARPCSTPPTRPIPNGLSDTRRFPYRCRRRSGSTSRVRRPSGQRRDVSKLACQVSQSR